MSRFASKTEVPVERSKADIEGMLVKYGATHFTSGWGPDFAEIAFCYKSLHVRFTLPTPKADDPKFKSKKIMQYGRPTVKKFTEQQSKKLCDQETRSRWRALALVVKAKLEAVEIGISTMEMEFLAFIVLPNTKLTIGDWMQSNAMEAIRGGTQPLQLTSGPRVVESND